MNRNETFCEKIREYKNAMYALSFSILRNDEDVADAISESVIKAYCHVDQLKDDKAFKAWLLKIVHHTSVEMLRQRHPTVDIDEQTYLADGSSPGDLSTKIALREAVEALRQPYRTVVVLYYYECLSVEDISVVTSASKGAVKKQLSRAREILRQSLSKEDFFG